MRPSLLHPPSLLAVALVACGNEVQERAPRSTDPAGARDAHLRGQALIAQHSANPSRKTVAAAIEAFEEAVEKGADDAGYHYWAGRAHELLDGDARALELYRAAVDLDPEHSEARWRLGHFLYEDGRLEEARAELERARDLGLENTDLLLGLGQVLEELGDTRAARAAYERALTREPTSYHGHFRLSHVLRLLGDEPGAQRELAVFEHYKGLFDELNRVRKAADAAPDDAALQQRLAQIQFQLRQDDAAAASMQRAVEASPEDSSLLYEQGVLLLQLRRGPQALAVFDTLIARDGEHIEARLGRAEILAGSGRPKEAADEYRAVLAINPDDERARASLEFLEGDDGE